MAHKMHAKTFWGIYNQINERKHDINLQNSWDMKKIIVFLNAYSQGISGADKICIETWKHLDEKHITVMTSPEGKKMCDNFGLKARFVITTSEQVFQNPIQTYLKRIIFGIWNAITSSQQDILYSSSDQLPDILPALIFKLRNRNAQWIVRSYHTIPNKRPVSHHAQKLSWLLIKTFAATIITASTLMERKLIQHGFSSKNMYIVYPGISEPRIMRKKTIYKYDAVFMSRLHSSKGIFDLISIWKNVTKKLPNATLAIIGVGEKQTIQKLNHTIKINNLQNSIKLLGHQSDEKAQEIISRSQMFVFPSHEEGFSLTIAEVLLIGTPIIAYDLPIYQDVFPNALSLIPRSDINAFADQIIEVMSNRKKYDKKVNFGKSVAQKYTWKKSLENERAILHL